MPKKQKNIEELKKEDEIQLLEIDSVENELFQERPIFVIDNSPSTYQLSLAEELKVPIVVLITEELMNSDNQQYVLSKIPRDKLIMMVYVGDKANIGWAKVKWTSAVREEKRLQREERLDRKNNLSPLSVVPFKVNLQDILNMASGKQPPLSRFDKSNPKQNPPSQPKNPIEDKKQKKDDQKIIGFSLPFMNDDLTKNNEEDDGGDNDDDFPPPPENDSPVKI